MVVFWVLEMIDMFFSQSCCPLSFVHAFPRRLCDGRVARIHRAFFIVHLLETFASASSASPDRRVLAPYVSREAFYQSWRAMSIRNSVR